MIALFAELRLRLWRRERRLRPHNSGRWGSSIAEVWVVFRDDVKLFSPSHLVTSKKPSAPRSSAAVQNAGSRTDRALFANQIDIGYIGPGRTVRRSKGQGIRADRRCGVERRVSPLLCEGIGHQHDRGDPRVNKKSPRRSRQHAGHRGQALPHRHAEADRYQERRGAQTKTDQSGMMLRAGESMLSWAPEPWCRSRSPTPARSRIAEERTSGRMAGFNSRRRSS